MKEFFIINDVDRPDADHVVQKLNDKGECRYISQRLKHWGKMQLNEESIDMRDFGFDVDEIVETKVKAMMFTKQRKSKATYRDGSVREWQGDPVFSLLLTSGERS
ncbi:MAG: hypothetical protein DRH08_06180 [Deltaproteobacteria bacterium]|nr:MAG: hypothetical protein DRH08_06180 [Deltaproteobacteria bacterium]